MGRISERCKILFRAKSLFEKFEQFLESRQFFSKIHSVTCEKYDVKVELFLCEDGTQHKTFQFVYFNQLSEQHNGKWKEFVDRQCRKRFEKVSLTWLSVLFL